MPPKDTEGNFLIGKEKFDIVHDLLVFLAEEIITMWTEPHLVDSKLS
ncbi:MAG: hypothetical protein AEth_01181 [Candidatus Argoarchaeum ethanivorans]|uniref:Uncharacterized protein n=1 Tax=Candidatus Argoarchaeum ethanivorans TaxID=2608793 RepID=A0A8B3S2Y7_9EURY|nr:MAG: hypothetical protein AEth_01181 [Candidatus Argoarchaeum ethanivorans]